MYKQERILSTQINILGYFIHASIVVKSVMFILLLGSVASWTLIFERILFFRAQQALTNDFLKRFWRSSDLSRLYFDLDNKGDGTKGIAALFHAGFQAYWKRRQQQNIAIDIIDRVMQIEQAKQAMVLQKHLAFFASIGSIAPFIGLFGTVWGIMTSFQALGQAQQATIAMVAPGISEALVATALGLFTAIPGVIAYNRFNNLANNQLEQYELFQQELMALIEDQEIDTKDAAKSLHTAKSQRVLSSLVDE